MIHSSSTNPVVSAGNSGPQVKCDCQISMQLRANGGLQIELESKVKVFYSRTITSLCKDILHFFGVDNAWVQIQDSGALDFVIAARMEAVIKKLIQSDRQYCLDMIPQNNYESSRDRFRFSRLYLPGNNPYLMINAGIHQPHGIILDLEDAVAPSKKDEARILVRNALRSINFYGVERMVRINQGDAGICDLNYVVLNNVHLLLLPKCEDPYDVKRVEAEVNRLKSVNNIDYPIFLMPIIESALGVEKAYEIATASANIVAMAIGLEDYTADLGVNRTSQADESLYARTRLVNACHAAKIQPIDSVFSDVGDMEGLANNVKVSKALGFEGMGCIHPRQIETIHQYFAPEEVQIQKAMKIVNAFYKAQEKGLTVVALGTKMIDPPVVKRNQKIIDLAINLGIIPKDWRMNYEG